MRFEPITSHPHMLHGADYNPEQWKHIPGIWEEDMSLMNEANINVTAVGIFSWSTLEPSEGNFDFEWLDQVLDNLSANGKFALLATPSGARPAWMSARYPEVLRVREDGHRNKHGFRHNHCFTSPIYREKVAIINEKLAKRYSNHPAVIGWHISNEYHGECHCDLCQEAFRGWLKVKYENNLDKVNKAWWTKFWGHDYYDWSEIEGPSEYGETSIDGLVVDWKRFVVDQTVDFMKAEIEVVRRYSKNKPVTTNFHGLPLPTLNYWKFAEHLDVISWDLYPKWSRLEKSSKVAAETAFVYDIARSLKGGQPFMLMENTPSTSWFNFKQLRPGVQLLTTLQAVAHGSDTVQYFQWRKSLGCSEKFHGAIVDHSGSNQTKIFKEVSKVGDILSKLDEVVGTSIQAEVALIYDLENHWAIDSTVGLQVQEKKQYLEECKEHYYALWKKNISMDVIDSEVSLTKYKVVIAPMLFMLKPKAIQNIEAFVKAGGILVTTYWTGMVDENNLCFYGGFPGPLREVCGILMEENDALNEGDSIVVRMKDGQDQCESLTYSANTICNIIHAESAEVLATFASDYYDGYPALTKNSYGQGRAYYIAFRGEENFLDDLYEKVINTANLKAALDIALPYGVSIQSRTDGNSTYIFMMNFTAEIKEIDFKHYVLTNMITGDSLAGQMILSPYEIVIMKGNGITR